MEACGRPHMKFITYFTATYIEHSVKDILGGKHIDCM